MNLTWHIFKKDIFGLRIPLALWTLVILGQVIIGERLFHGGSYDPAWFDRQGMLLLVLSVMDGLVCYFLVEALIKEDSPVGSRLFWVTRPISGARLLSAKLIGIGIAFLLWPVVVLMPWWLANGFGWQDVSVAARQMMTLHLFIAFPAMLLAVITDSYGQFAVWTIVLVVALCVVPGVISMTTPKAELTGDELFRSQELLRTRFWVSLALIATTTAFVVWLQYCIRRRVHSVVLAGLGIGLSALSLFFWPWSLSGHALHVADSTGTERITAEFTKAEVANRSGKSVLTVYLRFGNVPLDIELLEGKAEIELRGADGSVDQELGTLRTSFGIVPLSSWVFNLPPANPDPATEQKRNESKTEFRARRSELSNRSAETKADIKYATAVFTLEPESIAKILAKTSTCTVAIEVPTSHPRVLLEVPLKKGAGASGDGFRLSIVKYSDDERKQPQIGSSKWVAVVFSQGPFFSKPELCLLDRRHGARLTFVNFSMTRFTTPALALQFERSDFHVPVPQIWRNEQWVDAPDWLEGYTLAAVRLRPDGNFARTITIDPLNVRTR